MQIFRTLVLAASVVVLSSFTALAAEQAPAPGNPLSRMWSAVEQAPAPNDSVSRMLNEMKATARPAPPVVDSRDARIAALEKQVSDLEQQLANRDRELAGLRGDLSAEMAKLNEAQRGLMRALRPEVEQGNITVDVNNERLLINLASSMLFGSGEDQLKPAGADALKQVGAILKDYPEYKVHVDGHTDNRVIQGALKKKFPTNKELSEARAANAVKALEEGGLSAASTAGYADTKPIAPNATDAGRAKNRRVEVRVTRS